MPDVSASSSREALTPTLRTWRRRALYTLLTVIAVAGLPAYIAPLLNARASGGITPLLWAYLGIYIAFVALALAPSLPESTRAFGLMGLAYANGIASMARLGLAGSGRLYLLVMPVVAALLLGSSAGYISAGVSLLIYAAFTYLAGSGQLAGMLTEATNPTSLSAWLEAGLAFVVFLVVLAVLVERFADLLVRALASQQRTSSELATTARMLQERESVLVRQKDTLAALHETAVGVASARDVERLLTALVERSVTMVGAAYGWLYLVDAERDELVAHVGTGMFQRHVGVRLKRGEGLSGQIWAEGRASAVDNYRFWEGRSAAFEGDAIGPAMGVPLYVGGQVAGVIGLTRLVYSKPFTEDELDAMGRLGELAGILMTNAQLHNSLEQELAARVEAQAALEAAYQDLERRVEERTAELAALHQQERERRAEAERSRRIADGMSEIVAALNSQQSLAETLSFIVTHACRMLNSQGAAVFRLEQAPGREAALGVQAGYGLGADFVERGSLPYPDSIAGRALREQRAIAVPSIRDQLTAMADDLAPSPYLQQPEMRNLMATFEAMLLTPLTIAGQPYGVLAAYYHDSRAFSAEDMREAQSLADQAALGIESARLREQAGQAAALDERNRLARGVARLGHAVAVQRDAVCGGGCAAGGGGQRGRGGRSPAGAAGYLAGCAARDAPADLRAAAAGDRADRAGGGAAGAAAGRRATGRPAGGADPGRGREPARRGPAGAVHDRPRSAEQLAQARAGHAHHGAAALRGRQHRPGSAGRRHGLRLGSRHGSGRHGTAHHAGAREPPRRAARRGDRGRARARG